MAYNNSNEKFLSLKETQDVELEIMQKIHEFCESENMIYCLTYGSLIGAIRHKGFIPWDNDMDIVMPRPDYERFLQLTKSKPIGKDIECVHYTNDPKYHYQVIRVCDMRTVVYPTYIREQPTKMGVWVDIFPADGVPVSFWDHPIYQIKLWFYKWIQLADIYAVPLKNSPHKTTKGLISNICKNIAHILFPGKNNVHEYKIDFYASKFRYEEYELIADIIERQKPNWLTHEDFEERILMKFDKYEFYVPKDWHGYCSRYYGDYMQLPPEEKRMTHDIQAQWR